SATFFQRLGATIRRLDAIGQKIIVLGPPMEFERSIPFLFAQYADEKLGDPDVRQFVMPGIFDLDERMQKAVTAASYISVLAAVCPERTCRALIAGIPIVW